MQVRHGLFAIGLIIASSITAQENGPSEPSRRLVDHHVHILGPGLVRDWKSLGVPFSKEDSAYTSAAGLLGEDGILDGAILVPMAHLYGNEEFRGALGISEKIEYERVSKENDHVAAEARKYEGRAVAYCSVSYLRPYAWEELRRCRSKLESPGIKLHLANAGTDLRNPEHLAALEKIMSWAEEEDLAVLLHFDPQRRGLEVEQVDTFIESVLDPHPDLRIQIAHLGGSGGCGDWMRSVFLTFVEWLERAKAAGRERPGVTFDLSAVILEEESEGVPATTDKESARLAEDLRRGGLSRIVFASDYPVFGPARYAEVLRERVGLNGDELSEIMTRRGF